MIRANSLFVRIKLKYCGSGREVLRRAEVRRKREEGTEGGGREEGEREGEEGACTQEDTVGEDGRRRDKNSHRSTSQLLKVGLRGSGETARIAKIQLVWYVRQRRWAGSLARGLRMGLGTEGEDGG
jgi:hypothetical protein